MSKVMLMSHQQLRAYPTSPCPILETLREGVSFADCAVGPSVLAIKRFGASLKEFPNLAKYAAKMEVRSRVQLPCMVKCRVD